MANHAAAALLIASLLVAVTLADARIGVQEGSNAAITTFAKTVPALTCNKVHGFQKGDTCFDLAQSVGLTQAEFLSFNPNLNCLRVFLGQWVCLDASSA